MTRFVRSAALAVALAVMAVLAVSFSSATAGADGRVNAPPPGLPGQHRLPPMLTDSYPCPQDSRFTCSILHVPLDRTGAVPGTLSLHVEVQAGPLRPKGYLVFLTGGPGAHGASYPEDLSKRYPEVSKNYSWVSLDFRGTGLSGALHCSQLQRQLGEDDFAIPTLAAIRECSAILGRTATMYSVTDTVADLDELRQVLGVQTWALDGISYGTYVGERYTLAHPHNVSKLVLDSVVPHTGVDPLAQNELHAFGRVLRSWCAEQGCDSDPAVDLNTVLRNRSDGATVSDAILWDGIFDGVFERVPRALHDAARGKPAGLNRLLADRAAEAAYSSFTQFSQGDHAASLCADMTWPWKPGSTPAQRAAALRAEAAKLPASAFYPFTAKDAVGNGLALTCENWPSSPAPVVPREMPPVPTLLMGGTHDLSTPIEDLLQEAAVTPNKVVWIFDDTGHSQQTWNGSPAAVKVMTDFLNR